MQLEKYSIGHGDRFGNQGVAQLDAILAARAQGIDVVPVWNKSFREHSIVGSSPAMVRQEADAAVAARGYQGSYYVDADHINLSNVEAFLAVSDFFTIDVAEAIGAPVEETAKTEFLRRFLAYEGPLQVPGIERPFAISPELLSRIADKYLAAVQQAAAVYRHICTERGEDRFIAEVSVDETDEPQSPVELFFILGALAEAGVRPQTIAPRFTGRFNKGVNYVGDVATFTREFREDIAVLAYAHREFGLPANLKLSVHSGSDKFAIYEPIHRALKDSGAGLHLKTAGTTWLEEIIGLAEADGEGLSLAKEIYATAYEQADALCAPYAAVIDIDRAKLPAPQAVQAWTAEQYVAALRHDLGCDAYNPNLRQLLHVGYKVAASMGERFTDALVACRQTVSQNVTENLLVRHIQPLLAGL